MSKPRPIHTMHRDLRDTPDEAEPSFSYEQESFLGREEDDMEDEFHRRLASTARVRESSGGMVSGPGDTGGGGGSRSSFWRTTSDSTWQGTPDRLRQKSAELSHSPPPPDVPRRESYGGRRASGGLLGAAIKHHSNQEEAVRTRGTEFERKPFPKTFV